MGNQMIRNLSMIKINMGCGWRNFGSDWIHVDAGDYDHLDYKTGVIDLSQFKKESVDLVYASHVIEYFDRNEVTEVLLEWKRILKPGATLRLAVPNFAILSRLYLEGKVKLGNILGPLYGRMEMDGKYIYHKTTYDYESLAILLDSLGFEDIRLYDWRETEHANFDDHSQAYFPHMDKENGTLISLNMECIKGEL